MRLICINCPRGCEMEIGDDLKVTGNACPKGEVYAKSEMTNPVRMVTGLVRVNHLCRPLSVKTREPVPKAKIRDVLQDLSRITVNPPIHIGDVIAPNIVATSEILV